MIKVKTKITDDTYIMVIEARGWRIHEFSKLKKKEMSWGGVNLRWRDLGRGNESFFLGGGGMREARRL